jgi:hypothetical protein
MSRRGATTTRTTEPRGRYLAKLRDGEDFEEWDFKLEAWAIRNDMEDCLNGEDDDEEKQKRLWAEVGECCEGEAASVVREAEKGNGEAAYDKLKERSNLHRHLRLHH